jgi:hypothetical protein
MKIKQILLLLALMIGSISLCIGPMTSEASAAMCGGKVLKSGETCCGSTKDGDILKAGSSETCCAGVITSVIKCADKDDKTDLTKTGIWSLLMLGINILTAGIGVAAIGGIVVGSIMYTTAGGSSEQVKKANTIITNTVIGIIVYAMMYTFLNFLIPGGLF